ncbi:D-glycero-beta-D-manno-heptose-7-phosphate kinase [Selenomonas sp. TAMA-11512]|uniref:bifunctional heptose 7-phosphate kinase/heptose 1-phosphate adenyltransferase n=1 Tax=Selenomonas sp. TAMA-11512 TaxID=3095337 RepID=UPI0030903467|nr:D-glycero-beta-D-manno-heptose-7-phosphate kinase [Selenomonas sp. TAMA-11512]
MKAELSVWMDEMAGKALLVIGDVVADRYIDGRISRISREAPVLVLEEVGEKIVAGGSANVANNGATLGGRIFAAGVVGTDGVGERLREVLGRNGVDTNTMVALEGRPTISKTRIIAGGRATVSQQIVRIDRESKEPLSETAEKELLAGCLRLLPKVEGVVLSDYGSGTVTQEIRRSIIAACRKKGIPTMVDSRYDVKSFHGIDYVKQNDGELAAAVGRTLKTEEELFEAGQELLHSLDAAGVLVTRGEKGMVLFEADGSIHDIPVSDKSEVFDVSGAGDTCVAMFMLAIAAGAAPPAAAELANIASGVAVRKMGTATVSADELREILKQ